MYWSVILLFLVSKTKCQNNSLTTASSVNTTSPTLSNTTTIVMNGTYYNMTGNGTYWWNITYVNGTAYPINATTVSTVPPTLEKCMALENFDFKLQEDCKPCQKCFNDLNEGFIARLADVMACREQNGFYPIPQLKEEPILITYKVNNVLYQVANKGTNGQCEPYFMFSYKFLLTFGKKKRLSDLMLPEYNVKPFSNTNNRWEKQNDTMEIPYGNIVRGKYTYVFAIYKNFTYKKLPVTKTRLKKEWPEKHPIINGEYLDPKNEEGLYTNGKLEFNSVFVSIDQTPHRKFPLPGENKISFWKLDRTMVNPVCVYWQPLKKEQNQKLPTTGYWSNFGVRVHKENVSFTVCMASQFGVFAVVAEPYVPPKEEPIDPLDVLVVIFTIVSCCLIIIFILALFMLKCVHNPYSRIYLYLAFSCLLSQLIFLGGLANRNNSDKCTQVGTWIQFCHVSVITWVMIESIHQLSRLRYFFNEKTNVDAFYFALGWGYPLAVLIALQGFPYEKIEKQRYCWIYVNGFDLWFFAGPLVVMLFITIVIRLLMYSDIRKNPEKVETDINYMRAYRSLIASAGILPTFSVLWIFGTYAIKSESAIKGVALIALPLLNLAVGIEILYFYFYRNDEVRDALKRELNIREKQKLGTYHYLRGLKINANYRDDTPSTSTSDLQSNFSSRTEIIKKEESSEL